MKMWLKSCPRCRGDMIERKDHYGSVISCLQCSHEIAPSGCRLVSKHRPGLK